MFRCRVRGVQSWVVRVVDSQKNPEFNKSCTTASDGGPDVHTLSIVARSDYNGTRIECYTHVNTDVDMSTATLTIQGTWMYDVSMLEFAY